MEKRITVKDILVRTVNSLNSIMLPVALVDSVGQQIAANVHNLQSCVAAIEQEEQRMAEQAAAEAAAAEEAEEGAEDAGEDEE